MSMGTTRIEAGTSLGGGKQSVQGVDSGGGRMFCSLPEAIPARLENASPLPLPSYGTREARVQNGPLVELIGMPNGLIHVFSPLGSGRSRVVVVRGRSLRVKLCLGKAL